MSYTPKPKGVLLTTVTGPSRSSVSPGLRSVLALTSLRTTSTRPRSESKTSGLCFHTHTTTTRDPPIPTLQCLPGTRHICMFTVHTCTPRMRVTEVRGLLCRSSPTPPLGSRTQTGTTSRDLPQIPSLTTLGSEGRVGSWGRTRGRTSRCH